MKFELEHTFPVDRSRYEEEIFFDQDFNARISEALNLGPKDLQEERIDDEVIHRVNLIHPRHDLPTIVRKALKGKGIGYFESSTFYRKEHRASWSISSELMPNKIKGKGEIHFEETPNGVRRRVTGEINVSLFGVGGMVEKLIVDNVVQSYNTIAELTYTYLKEQEGKDN